MVEEIAGEDCVTGIKVKNLKNESTSELKVDGVFAAIGDVPNSRLAAETGVKLTEEGFIEVDRDGRTNIPRLYAAGDVTGGVRQIVTAVGEGATTAPIVSKRSSSLPAKEKPGIKTAPEPGKER